MFSHSYFAATYFAPVFWAPAAGAVVPPAAPAPRRPRGGGGDFEDFRMRTRRQRREIEESPAENDNTQEQSNVVAIPQLLGRRQIDELASRETELRLQNIMRALLLLDI